MFVFGALTLSLSLSLVRRVFSVWSTRCSSCISIEYCVCWLVCFVVYSECRLVWKTDVTSVIDGIVSSLDSLQESTVPVCKIRCRMSHIMPVGDLLYYTHSPSIYSIFPYYSIHNNQDPPRESCRQSTIDPLLGFVHKSIIYYCSCRE